MSFSKGKFPEKDIYIDKLSILLQQVVQKYFPTREHKVGVLISGGLDSSVITCLMCQFSSCEDLIGIAVGTTGSRDVANAEELANHLEISMKKTYFDRIMVQDSLQRIVSLVGTPNPVLVSIAIPFYFACETAQKSGITHLFCGQGADELFAGYFRYITILQEQGTRALKKILELDIENLLCNVPGTSVAKQFGIKLLLPFLNEEVISYSRSIPVSLKVKTLDGVIRRKYILRKVAQNMGLPENVVWRKKLAVQYGSGSMKLLSQISKVQGYKKVTPFLESLYP